MTSTAPVVRQIAWISIVPQFALITLLMTGAHLAGFKSFILVGAAAYFALSFSLRRMIPREHQLGMGLFQKEKFAEAIPHFQKSYQFFTKHRWLDDWRFITLLSSSRISYREMALLNVGYCYAQAGDGNRARVAYQRAAKEFPKSGMAAAALKLMKAARKAES